MRGWIRRELDLLPCAVFAALGLTSGMPLHDASAGRHAVTPRFKAVAFDYLALFNAESAAAEAERVAPDKGPALMTLWRTRQFEYCWLRSMTKQYVDFERVTDDALAVAERQLHLTLTTGQHNRLSRAFLHLDLWQDAPETLRALRASGVRVIVLANFSPRMLRANADHAGIAPLFEALVSTDERRTYKPDPRAYRLALDHLHLDKREVLFVASAGWDAAGAKAFGLPTVWVNRVGQPDELLGAVPDRTVGALAGVLSFVLPSSTAPRHAS